MRNLAIIFSLAIVSICSCGSPTTTPDGKPSGETIYKQYCVTCHGGNGRLGLNGAKDLSASALTLEERVEVITNGRKLMASFSQLLQEDEIKAVAEFTMTFK